MQEQKTAFELFQMINQSAGMKYLNRVDQLSFSQNVFRINASELEEAAQRIEDPDQTIPLMSDKNREAGRQSHRELNRRLHNFVSSAQTLVEHTRIFMRTHYKGTKLFSDYDQQVQVVFVASPVARFTQDFRNYILHRGLPNSSMFLKFESSGAADGTGTIETGVQYPTATLLEWDGWKPTARNYLENTGQHLNLLAYIQEYVGLVHQLHVWLERALSEHHQNDIEEFNDLQMRYLAVNPEPIRVTPSIENLAGENISQSFHFDPVKVSELNQASSALLEKIGEIIVGKARRGFETDIPMVKITEEQILEPITGWIQDVNARPVFVFIRHEGKPYGFSKDDFGSVEQIIDGVLKEKWAYARLSREFTQKSLLDWARERFDGGEGEFSDALLKNAKEAVAPYEVWAPIAHLMIEHGFQFGSVRIESVSAEKINWFRSGGGPPGDPAQTEAVDQLFNKLRGEIQGYAAVVVSVEAEPLHARKLGLQIAQDTVGLLRLLSPAAINSFALNSVVLKGEANIPMTKLILRGASNVMISESMLVKDLGFWSISKESLAQLQPGIDAVSSLLATEQLSEFALAVRASILTYTKGTTDANPLDRLQCALTAVEGILLKHDTEARAHNVARRMGLLLSGEPAERLSIQQKVQQAYWLREQPQLTAQGRSVEGLFATFTVLALRTLHVSLNNLSRFTSKVDFVKGVDLITEAVR